MKFKCNKCKRTLTVKSDNIFEDEETIFFVEPCECVEDRVDEAFEDGNLSAFL